MYNYKAYENHEDGDSVGHGMELAHMNPHEMAIMDKAQGGSTMIPGTHLKHYGRLEHALVNNPALKQEIMGRYEHHARGGAIGEIFRKAEEMKQRGRHGDSEMGMIGPHTRKMFDHMLNGGSINPMTKCPEYFGFGDFMSGVKSFGAKAADVAKNVGSKALEVGKKAAGKAQEFANTDLGKRVVKGAGAAGMGYLTGQSAKDAILGGVREGAGKDTAAGRFVNKAAKGIQQGKGAADILKESTMKAAKGSDNRALQAAGAAAGGKNIRDAAERAAMSYSKESDNPLVRAARGAAAAGKQGGLNRGNVLNMAGAAAKGVERANRRKEGPEEYEGHSANDLYGNSDDDFADSTPAVAQGGGGRRQRGRRR